MGPSPKVVFFANTAWYLFNFRLNLARHLRDDYGMDVIMICPDGPFRTNLQAEGFAWIHVPLQRKSMNPVWDTLTAFRLGLELRKIRPALMHNFALKCILTGTMAAWYGGVPRIVNEVTGLGALFREKALRFRFGKTGMKLLFRVLARSPRHRTIFQNEGDLQEVLPSPVHRSACHLIPGSGVDLGCFHPAEQPPALPTVLMASRLLHAKGIETYCRAAQLAVANYPFAQFQLAGSIDPGNPASLSEAEVGRLGEAFPMVQFLGHRNGMPELWRQASIAVLTSHYEGVPRSLVEAAASGLPLVATNIPGVATLVMNDRNGFQVPIGDPAALAKALEVLLGDPERARKMGRESRAVAETRFGLSVVLKATLAVYQGLGLSPATVHKDIS